MRQGTIAQIATKQYLLVKTWLQPIVPYIG
jgi:hypothetical protein